MNYFFSLSILPIPTFVSIHSDCGDTKVWIILALVFNDTSVLLVIFPNSRVLQNKSIYTFKFTLHRKKTKNGLYIKMLIVMRIQINFNFYFSCLPQWACKDDDILNFWSLHSIFRHAISFDPHKHLWDRSVMNIDVVDKSNGGDRHRPQAARMLRAVRLHDM